MTPTESSFAPRPGAVDLLIVAACLVLLAGSLVPFWGYINDDAFISFRYASRLVEGEGLTFNDGERVEGYSNFLWVLVSALLRALWGKEELLFAAKSLGVLLSAGTLVVTYATARRLSFPQSVAWIPPALLATNPAFALNTVNGLETALFTLLVALAFRVRLEDNHSGDSLFAVALVLASWTRPDGYYLSAVLLTAHLLMRIPGPRILRLGTIYAAGVAPHLLFKWAYYGSLLPNTFHAKPGSPGRGLFYLRDFAMEGGPMEWHGLPLLLLGLGVLVMPRGRAWYLAFGIALGSAVVLMGGDWMIGWRFVTPSLPLVFLGIGSAIAWISAHAGRHSRVASIAAVTVLSALLLLGFGAPRRALSEQARLYGEGQTEAHEFLGRWLAERSRPGDAVALMDIGMIGYYSDLRVIDLAGLVDAHIARSPGRVIKKVYDPAYVLDQAPEYIVLVGQTPHAARAELDLESLWFLDGRIAGHPSFRESYEYVLTRHAPFEGYLHLFRRASPARS